jgi:putative transposase
MARRPVFTLVAETFRTALSRFKSVTELTVHSDQGWQYKMQPFRAMLTQRCVTQSMSCKGNGFDNAAIESFSGTLKAEYDHPAMPDNIDRLVSGVHEYIRYYNHKRIKLGLLGLSAVKYRLRNTA